MRAPISQALLLAFVTLIAPRAWAQPAPLVLAQAGKPPALGTTPPAAIPQPGKPPALDVPGIATPAPAPRPAPAPAVVQRQAPLALEDALIRFLGWFGDEPRVNHPDPALRLDAIWRRSGYVRHIFPAPAPGATAHRVFMEVTVTGCTAVFQSVRRIGARTETSTQRLNIRTLTGLLSESGQSLAIRGDPYGTIRVDEGEGSPPMEGPTNIDAFRAAPGEPGYGSLALLAAIRRDHCAPG